MLKLFTDHINNQLPQLKNKKLLLAISGGLDSMVLWHLINSLFDDIAVAHCNFNLRDEASFADEAFVIQTAKDWGTRHFTTQFNTKQYAQDEKLSIQMAARFLRYQWFYELMAEHQFDFLLTAHHADDSLETFLINLSRGTGLNGLTGIPESHGQTIRPLLPFTRAQIKHFANQQNIVWREDLSNADTKYLRNKIRHEVIPSLKSLNPNFMSAFLETISHLQDSRKLVDQCVSQTVQNVIHTQGDAFYINIQKLKTLSHPEAFLYQYLQKFNFSDWSEISALIDAQSGKQMFSSSHVLLKDRDFLILKKQEGSTGYASFYLNKNNESISVPNLAVQLFQTEVAPEISHDMNSNSVLVDKSLLDYPLVVRKWEKGDYFYPLGLKGKKKISKFLKDQKVSLFDKEKIYLLCSQNEVVWVIGYRLDDRFKITPATQEAIKFEISV